MSSRNSSKTVIAAEITCFYPTISMPNLLTTANKQKFAQPLEFAVPFKGNNDLASVFGTRFDFDSGPERQPQLLLQSFDVGVTGSSAAGEATPTGRFSARNLFADHSLSRPNAEPFPLDPIAPGLLGAWIAQRQQRPCVARRNATSLNRGLNLRRKLKQAHQIGDRGTINFQSLREVFLRATMFIDVTSKRQRPVSYTHLTLPTICSV